MTFNSILFYIFLIVVFLVYYFPLRENRKAQNWLLLLSSYFFYGFADWRMLPILLVVTIIVFFLGSAIHKSVDSKKASWLTTLGVLTCVGLLMYFKYFNFFIDSFSSVLNAIGLQSNIGTFAIILPIGISFFTFKLISYLVEINRGKIEPCTDFVAFSTYIAFFPTLLSGPIDKPNTFIPQLQKNRLVEYDLAVNGFRQILWGLFQKVVIADNLARTINNVWNDIPNQSGSVLIIVAILYSVQLYTDFSGYSNVAIGVGKLFGFHITKNFNYPYFSRNVAEYWRNWHISLTSWLTDYVFMPLNIKFRNLGNAGIIMAIIINMVAVGMWHGANWTYAVFGLYHGLLFIPLILSGSFFKNKMMKTNQYGLPSTIDLYKIVRTFMLVTIGLIIFRAATIGQAWEYILGFFNWTGFFTNTAGIGLLIPILVITTLMFMVEWIQRDKEFPLFIKTISNNKLIHFVVSWILIIAIVLLGGEEQTFIYMQF